MRHYEIGVRIGELSLGDAFDGVLAWGLIDNRPFLRCLHGYALCLWRLGRFAEAKRASSSGCSRLNPSDNQGGGFPLSRGAGSRSVGAGSNLKRWVRRGETNRYVTVNVEGGVMRQDPAPSFV